MLRVITGKAKGHKLKAPKGLDVRPTTDRVKESIFNVLADIPFNSIVLDLYSGSGSIGIEFLSRGAEKCYFIDNSDTSIKIINENLEKTKLLKKAIIYKNKVHNAVRILGKKNVNFDFIFMDPPYEKGLVISTIEEISNSNILKSNGVIVAEHETNTNLPNVIFNYRKVLEKKYGSTTISFYKLEEE